MEMSTEEGIRYRPENLICMIILTRTSSPNSARINYFLIKNSYIRCGRYKDKSSLSYKCNEEIDVPVLEDGEFYWTNKIVPMINKKYCEIRANINSGIKVEYFGEYS
jgi:hypothetical protein